ncbi:MAG: DUF2391 family protein [Planctomycetota bacterium]
MTDPNHPAPEPPGEPASGEESTPEAQTPPHPGRAGADALEHEPQFVQDIRGSVRRIGGYLHRVTPVFDDADKVVSYLSRPLMVEFQLRDVMQVIVGSALLATPLAFTGEAWDLGARLPLINCLILTGLALLFVGVFTYANFYRGVIRGYESQFVIRVATTYLFSLAFVAVLLGLLEQTPWREDWETALKRVLLVGFPACLAGTAADAIK